MPAAVKPLPLIAGTCLLLTGTALAQPSQTAIAPASVGSPLVGLEVKSADNHRVGTIDNVIVGQNGQVQALVISVGGVLGVGAKQAVVSWNDLSIDRQRHEAITSLSRDELNHAPDFQAETPGSLSQGVAPLPKPPEKTD